MKLRFLGQSGYELQSKNTTLLIDPYLSDSVSRLAGRSRMLPIPIKPEDVRCDAVICTHDHADHLDPDSVKAMGGDPLFITTAEGKTHLELLGRQKVLVLKVGDSITVGDFHITAVFACHTVEAFGLIVRAEGKTLYFSGDTLYNEELFEIAKYDPDFTFICINGRLGNMNVSEALVVAKQIGAPVNIPNHYDMFASNSENPHLFSQHIAGGLTLAFNRYYDF